MTDDDLRCESLRARPLPDASGYAVLVTTVGGARYTLHCASATRVVELAAALAPLDELDVTTWMILAGADQHLH